jgi:murein DD-endopeptidase MepM/ murein hydrolase activator NlpD
MKKLTSCLLLICITGLPTVYAQNTTICLPLSRLKVNSGYGWRYHPLTGKLQFHKGVDLAARGDTVYCILDGIVGRIGNDGLTGNYIVVSHACGIESLYGHLSAIAVMPGDTVGAGSVLGLTGSTGLVTGEHLHFAVRCDGKDVPPLQFLSGLLRPP